MAHLITEREDGTAEAAFSDVPAWHNLGEVVFEKLLSEEFMKRAHLDWLVEQKPLYVKSEVGEIDLTPEGDIIDNATYAQVPDMLANVREDNGLVLGVVSNRYQLVQNVDAFRFLDNLLEDQTLHYESAFSLSGGKRVVITARMPKVDEIVPGDPNLRYLLISTSHDGTSALRFGVTTVRVVCANTYAMALQKDGKTIRELALDHTGKLEDKLDKAREIVGLANATMDRYASMSTDLAKHILTRDQWVEFLDIMCPIPSVNDPDHTEKREKAIRETRDGIERLFRTAATTHVDGMAGTAWAAFNAVTEQIDHLPRRGSNDRRRAEARWNVALFGIGRDQKERAFETLTKLVGLTA